MINRFFANASGLVTGPVTSLVIGLVMSPAAIAAGSAVDGPRGNADRELIDPASLLSLVQQDWNDDGLPDKALLVQQSPNDQRVGLRIYLSDNSAAGFHLAARHDAIGWAGQGQAGRPMLSASRKGVTLRSGNGRDNKTPWHEVLSIDRDDKQFVVSRYTVTWHNKEDISAGFRCDINLQAGVGIRNTSSLDSVPSPAELENWQRAMLPEGCRIEPGSQ